MFKKLYLFLKTFILTKDYKSRQKLNKHQANSLFKFLKNLNSDFYPKSLDLKDFNIIDKKIFMDNFSKINTLNIDEKTAFNIAIKAEDSRDFSSKLKIKNKNITIGLSSGTSQNRGVFLLSDEEIAIWSGYMLKKMLPKPYFKKRKIAFFLRANSNLYESTNKSFLEFRFFDLYKNIKEHITSLNAYKPDILIAPASVLSYLANANNLDIKPCKIISVAETLEPHIKDKLKARFNQTIHEIYQCTEGFLAHTCSFGHLHLNEDIVYFEKEWLDETRFVPIITDFKRQTQPIIRYRLNDILHIDNSPCECGSARIKISRIEGRCDEIIYLKDKFNKDFLLFPDFLRRAVLRTKEINEYCFVFNKKNYELFAYIDNLEYELELKNNLEFLFKDLDIISPKIMIKQYERFEFMNKRIRIKVI